MSAVLIAAVSCGGSPAPASADAPPTAEVEPPAADAEPREEQGESLAPREDAPPSDPVEERSAGGLSASSSAPASDICVAMCVQQGQARAVAIDVVERDCATRCESPPRPAPACVAAAAAARERVESVRMRKRAEKVWTELSRVDLHCGYQDGLLRGLRGVADVQGAARSAALGRALRADPFSELLCPSGGSVTAEQTASDAIGVCGIDEAPLASHADLDAQTYLVARAVELRWAAQGLDTSDHQILLDTLRLSTALARAASR